MNNENHNSNTPPEPDSEAVMAPDTVAPDTHNGTEDKVNGHGHDKSHSGVFLTVFLMLCALTGISFWVANSALMDNPLVGWTAMMAVSVAKALLVILFFMHLWWERNWKYVLTIPALIMAVLLVILLVPDVGYRTETYSQERRKNAPAEEWSGGASPLRSGEFSQPSD